MMASEATAWLSHILIRCYISYRLRRWGNTEPIRPIKATLAGTTHSYQVIIPITTLLDDDSASLSTPDGALHIEKGFSRGGCISRFHGKRGRSIFGGEITCSVRCQGHRPP